jgi:integrase
LITDNPAARLARLLPGLRAKSGPIELWSPGALALLLKTAELQLPEVYPLTLLLARTGMRGGEALTLQVDDVDFARQGIWVRRTWGSRVSARGAGRINQPKGGAERLVDMSQQLHDVLKAYVSQLAGPWIFPSTRSAPMHPRVFLNRWQELVELTGLPYKTRHALRHTYATMLLQGGASPVYVKEQLGHSSIRVTGDTYAHFIPGENRSTVDQLDTICHLSATNRYGRR